MQTSGFTIVAEKLNNIRYLSHFRSIHRGSYFTEMRTNAVRKLLPESWGFLCPVHTPDGTPCGLLNHISMACVPVPDEPTDFDPIAFKKLLCSIGMHAISTDFSLIYPVQYLPVTLDGVVTGYVDPTVSDEFIGSLRHLKCA